MTGHLGLILDELFEYIYAIASYIYPTRSKGIFALEFYVRVYLHVFPPVCLCVWGAKSSKEIQPELNLTYWF